MEQQSVNVEAANPQAPATDQKPSDKEINLRRLAQAKEKAEMELEKERAEKAEILQRLQHLESSNTSSLDDDLDDDGYVEARKLKKTISRLKNELKQDFKQEVQSEARRLLEEEKQKDFHFRVKAEMPDFEKVVTDESANAFADKFPEWANAILSEPDNYKKRKLTYEAIKGLDLHQKPQKSIQEKVTANQKNPYYYPSSIGSGGNSVGDFSDTGKKSAYEAMKALQKGFRGA